MCDKQEFASLIKKVNIKSIIKSTYFHENGDDLEIVGFWYRKNHENNSLFFTKSLAFICEGIKNIKSFDAFGIIDSKGECYSTNYIKYNN